MKRMVALLLCAAVFLGLLAGCDTNSAKPYVPTGDGLFWDQDETGPVVTQPQEDAQILTLTYYPDRSMNPITCTEYTNRALFSLIYQSLFAVDRNYHAEPQLCYRYFISEDMKSYTFYIMEKATFSDGTRLTPEDVVASLQAARSSRYYSGRFLHITSIAVTADGGVTVQVNTPMENLPLLLDIPIIKQSELTADFPLGTGPYAPEQTVSGLRLRRVSNWWCSADMIVTAPSIALKAATSITQIRDAFEFEDLDLVCADPGSDRYADYRCDYELWDSENGIFLYLVCNTDSKVFSNSTLRAALTYAIDRETVVQKYYRGFARSTTLPASPLSPYYSQTLAARYAYDSGKFVQAVSDTQMREQTVVLLVNSDDSLRLRVARDIGEMIAGCGLVVEMKELGGSEYQYALQTRDYDLYVGQTKLSPNMDLTAFFADNGSLSFGGIEDISMYALCLDALANHGNYYTLHKRIMDTGILCPVLFRSYAVYATRGVLTGLAPSRDNIFYYSLGRTMEDALISD